MVRSAEPVNMEPPSGRNLTAYTLPVVWHAWKASRGVTFLSGPLSPHARVPSVAQTHLSVRRSCSVASPCGQARPCRCCRCFLEVPVPGGVSLSSTILKLGPSTPSIPTQVRQQNGSSARTGCYEIAPDVHAQHDILSPKSCRQPARAPLPDPHQGVAAGGGEDQSPGTLAVRDIVHVRPVGLELLRACRRKLGGRGGQRGKGLAPASRPSPPTARPVPSLQRGVGGVS